MYWLRPRSQWVAGKGAGNKRALRRVVGSGARPGVIGYLDGQPVAWCAVAPRERYSGLRRSRVLRPVDEAPVWSITCLFVLRPYRRQGISIRMLRAAVAFAAKKGAAIVEGYPVVPTMARTPDAFVYTGVPSAFLAAGFREVLRRSRTRPIMRITIRRRSIARA